MSGAEVAEMGINVAYSWNSQKAVAAGVWWAGEREDREAEGGGDGQEGRPRQQVMMMSLTFVLTARGWTLDRQMA